MRESVGRVVVVEDEQPIRDAIIAALIAERFTAMAFADLPAPSDLLAIAPDLVILDVLLPNGNGFDLAVRLRRQRELPIIFLTARDAVADRVFGLELGADDYLVKPFALEELMARVRAVPRRHGVVAHTTRKPDPQGMVIGRGRTRPAGRAASSKHKRATHGDELGRASDICIRVGSHVGVEGGGLRMRDPRQQGRNARSDRRRRCNATCATRTSAHLPCGWEPSSSPAPT
jgi:DNA-binding response OmpR family regulator